MIPAAVIASLWGIAANVIAVIPNRMHWRLAWIWAASLPFVVWLVIVQAGWPYGLGFLAIALFQMRLMIRYFARKGIRRWREGRANVS